MNKEKNVSRKLIIGAIGIVYGDIGTSPLYTFKECFKHFGFTLEHSDVFGILSLIFWTILIVVSLKYALLVLRADNQGEGGVLTLVALLYQKIPSKSLFLNSIGMLGAALFYGDSIITPAISVLSALEGLTLISPSFQDSIPYLSIIILTILFLIQKYGTDKISIYFGPIMICWFSVIGLLGLSQVVKDISILKAINPLYAFNLFINHGLGSLLILGTTILAVTGAEALYADLGHFGKKPIRKAWFYFVWPCLILNYFGQANLVIHNPQTLENPFYHLAPDWAISPLIVLSTLATIIAAQSIISGIFSITHQACQLGYLPRLKVVYPSVHQGQVYIPTINTLLMIATSIVTLLFRNSSNLAAAYGLVVAMTMLITTYLLMNLVRKLWQWSWIKIFLVFSSFISIDLLFVSSNFFKLFHGGWFTIIIAIILFIIMKTWYQGRENLRLELRKNSISLECFIKTFDTKNLTRISGTAIYLTSFPDTIPLALNLNFHHYRILHKQIILLSIIPHPVPSISPSKRISLEKLANNLFFIKAHYGFKEIPNMHHIITKSNELGLSLNFEQTSFFISRTLPVYSKRHTLGWRKKIFMFLFHNATDSTDYYAIPSDRAIDIAMRFKI